MVIKDRNYFCPCVMKFNKNKDKLLIKKRYQPNICIKFITKIEISEFYFKIKIYAQEYGHNMLYIYVFIVEIYC
jgi:hypothetical protein